ncbi:NUDIX domain-containing protein [Candidatus Woesearchaeota archaeon]|nr:MAG: MutT-like protein [archaeon GW2011_AR4]MBS3130613.1 NUDIX domain-containing protein [Candidatus Woesearchaeota archaeon]HIH39067.1 NUDIX domain-containing protein [Candidatus Woesearchaeota archaeon]HIH48273.1 NUDIX domain-containing protein [Candidatus Woesearchaeota archaeon]HIJ03834.1 NUDIX domain-containing protein [Candidatus Woesearchaeota archaeon]
MSHPISVVLAAIVQEGNLIIIKRREGSLAGFYGLPGGKIEHHEHLQEAIIREVKEETNIDAKFEELISVISEVVISGEERKHFLLHLCRLKPLTRSLGGEELASWVPLSDIGSLPIIPSDLRMITDIIQAKRRGYYDCVMRKNEEGVVLEKFLLVHPFNKA